MIEETLALGEEYKRFLGENTHIDDILSDELDVDYVFTISLKTKQNNELAFDDVEQEEVSDYKKYRFKRGEAQGSDYTPSSILNAKEINNTMKRLKKWAKQENKLVPDFLTVLEKNEKEIKEKINEKLGKDSKKRVLLTIKIDGRYLNEILPPDYIFKSLLKRCGKYADYSSIGKEKKCFLCGKQNVDVYGLTLQTIGFKFYTADKPGFLPQFDRESSWKQIPICEECSKLLIYGKAFLDKYLCYHTPLGFDFYVVPVFISGQISKKLIDYLRTVRSSEGIVSEALKGVIKKEDDIYVLLEEMENEINMFNLSFLFYREEQKRFLILGYAANLRPSWIQKIGRVQEEVMKESLFNEEQMKMIFGKQHKNGLIKEIYDEKGTPWWIGWSFQILSLPGLQKNGNDEFIEFLSSVFQNRKISYSWLVSKFNFFLEGAFKNKEDLRGPALHTLAVYFFLEKLSLLKGDDVEETKESSGKKEEIFGYKIFSNNEKKVAFLVGALVNYLLYIQREERGYSVGEEPFRKRLSNLRIDKNKLRSIFVEAIAKLNQYRKGIPQWFTKDDELFLNTSEDWMASVDEISYFFTLGLALGHILNKNVDGDKNE